jgi:hypothetical protein
MQKQFPIVQAYVQYVNPMLPYPILNNAPSKRSAIATSTRIALSLSAPFQGQGPLLVAEWFHSALVCPAGDQTANASVVEKDKVPGVPLPV